VVYEKLEAL
jgi:hypothetical protein